MADESPVLTESRGAVLVITINRPDARNSMNRAAAEAMGAALDQLDADPSLAVGVIVRAQSRLRGVEPARQVVVRHANAHARKVFEITGLDRILRLEP